MAPEVKKGRGDQCVLYILYIHVVVTIIILTVIYAPFQQSILRETEKFSKSCQNHVEIMSFIVNNNMPHVLKILGKKIKKMIYLDPKSSYVLKISTLMFVMNVNEIVWSSAGKPTHPWLSPLRYVCMYCTRLATLTPSGLFSVSKFRIEQPLDLSKIAN